MSECEDRELEEALRALPTAGPREALRERILRAAEDSRRPRSSWRSGLAFALCLLGLVALDVGIVRVQSARLSRVIGDGRQITAASRNGDVVIAFRQRNELLIALGEKGELGWIGQTRQ